MDVKDIPDRLDVLFECRITEKVLRRNGTVRLEFEVGCRGASAEPLKGSVIITKEALAGATPGELHRTLESMIATDLLHAAVHSSDGSDWPYGHGVCWQCMGPVGT